MPEQMIRILDCLKINKAPGPDGIYPGILKWEEKIRDMQNHWGVVDGLWGKRVRRYF